MTFIEQVLNFVDFLPRFQAVLLRGTIEGTSGSRSLRYATLLNQFRIYECDANTEHVCNHRVFRRAVRRLIEKPRKTQKETAEWAENAPFRHFSSRWKSQTRPRAPCSSARRRPPPEHHTIRRSRHLVSLVISIRYSFFGGSAMPAQHTRSTGLRCGRPVALELSTTTRQLERSGSWQGKLQTSVEDAFIYTALKRLACIRDVSGQYNKQCEMRGLFMSLVIHYWIGDVQVSQGVSASEMTYIVSGWALNSTHSLQDDTNSTNWHSDSAARYTRGKNPNF